jgi:hypothetical protein
MTTINFVAKDEAGLARMLGIRHAVVTITTGALVIYLVVVAGICGWWWYWSARQKKATAEIDSYLTQISSYSESEVVARRLGARAEVVASFLANRGAASDAARILTQEANEVQVTGWAYEVAGNQTVKVKSVGPEQIFALTKYLEDKYGRVQPDEIGWNVTDGWNGRILLSGRKKAEI